MKRFIPLLALSLTFATAGAYAQTTTPAAPAPAAPATTAPGTAAPKAMHHRMSLADKFNQANTSHDGKLTMDQAKAGFPYVARNFDAIDTGKKGYVTVDDIKAYAKMKRQMRHGMSKPMATPATAQ